MKWEEVDRFLASLRERAAEHDGYVAVMEVCGFNGWLVRRLEQQGCKRVCVISASDRIRQKTDRRDAARLSELLWINRDRIDPSCLLHRFLRDAVEAPITAQE